MKRLISILMALILTLMATGAMAGGWGVPSKESGNTGTDTVQFTGIDVKLIDDLATRSGPSTSYTGCGSYRMRGQIVTALSRAYDHGGVLWIEIEFSYGGGYRRAWTGAKRLSINASQLAKIPEEDLYSYIGYGTLNTVTSPRFGPGSLYATYGDRDFHRGDRVVVIAEVNSYYKTECSLSDGSILRSWIPASAVNLD